MALSECVHQDLADEFDIDTSELEEQAQQIQQQKQQIAQQLQQMRQQQEGETVQSRAMYQ